MPKYIVEREIPGAGKLNLKQLEGVAARRVQKIPFPFFPSLLMKNKIKIHDGIVGAVISTSVILGLAGNPQWLYVAGAIGVLMVSSAFTGFCPVYFVLNKMMPPTGAAE